MNESDLRAICAQHNARWMPPAPDEKLGISLSVKDRIQPINGLRHPPVGDTSGWYVWAGEKYSEDSDFFVPLHVEHVVDWSPDIQKFLGLPPGWRFLKAGDYEDVWYDETLLRAN